MIFVFILFLISLISISFILIKRASFLRSQEILIDHTQPILPDLKEVRYVVLKNAKRYTIILIAIILRGSIRTSIFVKQKSKEFASKFKKQVTTLKNKAYHPKHTEKIQKENNFLKAMSEYKTKIKKLKQQIIEEETNH